MSIENVSLSLHLQNALQDGNAVLFVGAGIAANVNRGLDVGLTGAALAEELGREFGVTSKTDDLAHVAELVELRRGRTDLVNAVRRLLIESRPNKALASIFTRPWKAIFTTNYDSVIQHAFDDEPDVQQSPYTISRSSDFRLPATRELPIVHLHGWIDGPAPNEIIISRSDYARFAEKRRMLFESLRHHFASYPILYLGYSNQDPNWATVLAELEREFGTGKLPDSYRVDPYSSDDDMEILQSKRITTLKITTDDLSRALDEEIEEATGPRPTDLPSVVPTELEDVWADSPVGLERLLRSWEFLGTGAFDGTANVPQFLRGEQPTWSLIDAGRIFGRDAMAPLEEELVDFATSPKPGVRSVLVTGPAGYGLTTILRWVAVKLQREAIGRPLVLRPGGTIHLGDVAFAAKVLDGPLFLLVDNAADVADAVSDISRSLREQGLSACFVVAERQNEWLQASPRLRPNEIAVDLLSDREIEALLDYLSSENSLNVLADLPRDLQRVAVREKHGKELLVTLQELTQGRAFEGIIEDEYRGISSEAARRVYGIVSAFYRHRVRVRDRLLMESLGLSAVELHNLSATSLSGVVMWEPDPTSGSDSGGARHHKIADIVWHRVLEPTERTRILLDAIKKLNLNYSLDMKAFEAFVKADDLVEDIGSLDDKISFFEAALAKEPDSTFVRQHYSRMLLREGRLDLALSEIESALQLREASPLYHTKGLVLTAMALASESPSMGVRRFAQAAGAFQACIAFRPKDDHGYTGLARLHLKWARLKARDEDEEADHLRRAEEAISDGLRSCFQKEHLYVESANVAKHLEDRPNVLNGLRKAVIEAPGGIYARLLLGRELNRRGEFDEAHTVLRSLVEEHPEEWSAITRFVETLGALGTPVRERLAVLQLADQNAYRNAEFLAFIGGHYWLDGKYSEADRIFSEARSRRFRVAEKQRTYYVPQGTDREGLWLRGTVSNVLPGYCFVAAEGAGDVFVPGTKYQGVLMEEGLEVTFQLAFSSIGATVAAVQPA